jgi:2-C-methyl-D-erythritol 4-phosphate cytidylyltransferase
MARRTVLPSPDVPDVVWSIVVAGGAGTRFGGPKQFLDLGGRPVAGWAVAAARAASDGVVLVVPTLGGADAVLDDAPDVVVTGGPTRSESVRCGLAAVPAAADIIVVHDAARPFAGPVLFDAVLAAVRAGADAAVPGVPVTDTIKQVTADGVVVTTPDRGRLRSIQTPQAFRAAALRRAHARGGEGTDDAALVETGGGHVVVVQGDEANRKITTPEDLVWARDRLVTGEAG